MQTSGSRIGGPVPPAGRTKHPPSIAFTARFATGLRLPRWPIPPTGVLSDSSWRRATVDTLRRIG